MDSELYLDTARLGRMCHGARSAEQDFCWLVSQLGSSLYLERFLTHGFESLPRRLRRRAPGLGCWQGVQQLGESLGRFVHQPRELPAFFFGQSTEMIRFAVESLLSRVHRILVTDLCWPPYLRVLQQAANKLDRELCVVAVKDMITSDIATNDDVVNHLEAVYRAQRCDGLFLTDIGYRGVRLPIEHLIDDLNPSFVVIDGAQAFHQRSVDLSRLRCDLYLAGTQKWFGAFHPLRLVFVGRYENKASICGFANAQSLDDCADGLFRFFEQLKRSSFPPFGATVNVSPLICAAGALNQAGVQSQSFHDNWQVLRTNAQLFARWVSDSRWRAVEVHESLGSGIVWLVPTSAGARHSGGRLRHALAHQGVVATAYDDGSLRFSMPRSYLSLRQLSEVSRALQQTLN